MQKAFILNPAISIEMTINALYEKTTQAKAIVECLLVATVSKELKSDLLFEAIWAVDNYLSEIKDLQERLELSGFQKGC